MFYEVSSVVQITYDHFDMETFITNIKKNYRDRAITYDEENWPANCSGTLMRLELVLKGKGKYFFAHQQHKLDIDEKSFKKVLVAYDDLFKRGKKRVRKILVEGTAGIGKTSLCISISKDWANGELFQEYKLLLLLPLHKEKVALAGSLSKLIETFMLPVNSQSIVSYLEDTKGEGLLMIADGWESVQLASFPYNLYTKSEPAL